MATKPGEDPPDLVSRFMQRVRDVLGKGAITATTEPVQQLMRAASHQLLDTLCIPDGIVKRAKSYNEARQLLLHTNKENLKMLQKNRKLPENKFDTFREYAHYGVIGSVFLGVISGMCDGPLLIFAILAGASEGTAVLFKHFAYYKNLEKMETDRQSAMEECENKLNEYASLLVGAVQYINAQIGLWNLRHDYLERGLAEPTDQDREHFSELRTIREDFDYRMRRLDHLYKIEATEKGLAAEGLDLERFHSKLNEYLKDLKPIVPAIATDPLMLEAIKAVDEIFEQHPPLEPAEIVIEEDEEKPEIT